MHTHMIFFPLFLLFNTGLENAMTKWKLCVQHCRSHCGDDDDDDDELLTNSHYVDDLMLYARTCTDHASMIESLVEEVAAVGLQLNTSNTKKNDDSKLEKTNVSWYEIPSAPFWKCSSHVLVVLICGDGSVCTRWCHCFCSLKFCVDKWSCIVDKFLWYFWRYDWSIAWISTSYMFQEKFIWWRSE